MTALKLLTHLRHQGIRIWVEQDQLYYQTPKNALPPALRTQVAEKKAELLDYPNG